MKDEKSEKNLKNNTEGNLEVGSFISRTEQFIERNQKIILSVIGVIVLLVVAYFLLLKPMMQKRESEAAAETFKAEYMFANQEYELALNGSDSLDFMGFAELADSYKCTKYNNLAKYYAGICSMRLGKFEDALDYFKSYKGKDAFTKAQCEMLKGDAELELQHNAAALGHYEKAYKMSKDNFVVAPACLFKAGMVYLLEGNNAKALENFQLVKSTYPESTEWNTIDKYIAVAESAQAAK